MINQSSSTGTLESVEIEELEKFLDIARVESIPADDEGYQDVLISSDKILPKRLKIGREIILKIASADDANERQRDVIKRILT